MVGITQFWNDLKVIYLADENDRVLQYFLIPVTKKLVFCFGISSAKGKTKITGAVRGADAPAMAASECLLHFLQ